MTRRPPEPPSGQSYSKAWRFAWAGVGVVVGGLLFFAGFFTGTKAQTPVAVANAKRSACITDLRSDLDGARTRKQIKVDERDSYATELTLVEGQALATGRDDPQHFRDLVAIGIALGDQVNKAQREVDAAQPAVDRALDRVDRLNEICKPVT